VGFLRRVAGGPVPEQPPAELEIDTDRSGAETSAATIVRGLGLLPESSQGRYPAP
jgi:hypothetical protein